MILNVAVAGTNGFFADGMCDKPWSDSDEFAANNFWDNRTQWLPTWGDDAVMQIDSVKVYPFIPDEVEPEWSFFDYFGYE